MRRAIILIFSLVVTGVAFAEICTDISSTYQERIRRLTQDTQTALSLTTDPNEMNAIRSSYELQKSQLEMERDSLLASSSCNGNVVVEPPVVVEPTPTPTVNPTQTPGDDDNDDGVSTPPGTSDQCKDLMDRIKAEAMSLGGKGFSSAAQYVHSRRAEIVAACGNYGTGRCQVGGNSHRK